MRVFSLTRPDAVASGVMLVGVILRLREWSSGRSLWRDEAMLALNVINRDFAGLAGPLDYNQMAPPGFLWAVKGLVLLVGPTELPLRAFALLAGIAALGAIWWLARMVFGPWPAALAACTAALSPALVYYSGELKPYSGDALCSAALLILALHLRNAPLSGRAAAALGLAGSLAVWLSYPAPFTLGAIVLSLALASRARGWRDAGWLAPIGALWFVNWLVVRGLAMRGPAPGFMRDYWADHFLWFRTANEWAKAASMSLEVVGLPFQTTVDQWGGGEKGVALVLATVVLGAYRLLRQGSLHEAVALGGGVVAVLAAALAHRYPLDARLLLFLAPAVLVLCAGGVTLVGSRGDVWPAVLIAAVSLLWPTLSAVQTLRAPSQREEVTSLLHTLAQEATTADAVYVFRGDGSAAAYYQRARPDLWRTDLQVVWGRYDRRPASAYVEEVRTLCGRKRVWVLSSHLYPRDAYESLLAHLSREGRSIAWYRAPGSALTLFDLTDLPCR